MVKKVSCMIKARNKMKIFLEKMKKILLVFLAILTLSLAIAPKANAAVTTSWYNQSFNDWFLRVYSGNDSEIFGERYTAAQVQWIFYSLTSQVIGILVGNNMDVAVCILGPNVESCKDAIFNGLKDLFTYEGKEGSVLASIATNPVSGIGYIKNVTNKFKLVPEAKAQEGFGFNAINPILKVWKVSRDITYSLLVIVVVVFAFMIMFRVKINPQTVITVQSALPKIVMAMVFITFSYAIAGLIIDFMYVFIGLIAAIIVQSGLSNFTFSQLLAAFLNRNLFTIYLGYWGGFFITAISTVFSENIILGLFSVVFALVLIIILLIQSFKGIFALLKNYAMLLIAIMTGPFEILFGTLNSSGGFGSWLMKIVSYTIVYPVITVIIFIAHFFLAAAMPDWVGDYAKSLAFNPAASVIGDTSWSIPFSAFEMGGMRIVWMAVSYMLIIMIPKVFDIIKSFMERKPFDYGTAIGQSFGPARGVWSATGGAVMQGAQRLGSERLVSNVIEKIAAKSTGKPWEKAVKLLIDEKQKAATTGASNQPVER